MLEKFFLSKIDLVMWAKVFLFHVLKNKIRPKRVIQSYIKRIDKFRNGEKSFNEPQKAMPSQTVSSWIASVIRQAHDNQTDLKVKVHSTRASGPSWALFKGASLNSILEAEDWSSDATVKKFYYRHISSQE